MINFTLKHENAQEPVRGSEMAAGWDLHAAEILRDTPHEFERKVNHSTQWLLC